MDNVQTAPSLHDEPIASGVDNLLERAASYLEPADVERVKNAYRYAERKHGDQKRKSGEPYINHPVEVATILTNMRMDADTIIAAILHDTVEDTDATADDVRELFGSAVEELVDGVTKLTNIEVDSLSDQQVQNLRKMFLAMSKDIRVIIIKLADRLHNMRTLMALKEDRRIFKARETMEVYAPLANRLGMSSIKWELEDLAFFYLEPQRYQQISRMVSDSREAREKYLEESIAILTEELERVDMKGFKITGRPKHLYSIYMKMQNKGKDFSEIYDLIALRVITEDIKDCYAVLGSVHSLWHPMPGRFKDYIAMPKNNMYRSLHTTVIGPAARPFEIQIRTQEMHNIAEYGIAAHWRYKTGAPASADSDHLDQQLAWIKSMLEWQEEDDSNPREFLNQLRFDLYESEVFVFTPKGEVMPLKKGSTPIDFAYAIHTEVGHHCVGAKINGSVVPLTYELQMGDRVEILTQRNSTPSRDWLNIVRTPSARSKIRSYFSKISRSDDLATGRDLLTKELRKHGFGFSSARTTKALHQVADQMSHQTVDDLLVAVGSNKVSTRLVTNKVVGILDRTGDSTTEAEKRALLSLNIPMRAPRETRKEADRRSSSNGVIVSGGDVDMLVRIAHCCNPVSGDEIVGFITRGRGVSVHRADCPNVADLKKDENRMIPVEWDVDHAAMFQVEIVIEALDRMRMLQDVTMIMGDSGVNILSVSSQTRKDGIVEMRFLFEIGQLDDLEKLLRSVRGIDGILDARRLLPGEGGYQTGSYR